MFGTIFTFLLTILSIFIAFTAIFGVKRTLVKLLDLYRKGRVQYLSFFGQTPSTVSEHHVVSGQAWADYCDTLKAAGASLLSFDSPMDPFSQAEGYRYLTRLIRGSLSSFMECSDYDRPNFAAVANGLTETPVKLGSDNPDNLYQNAMISSHKFYKITVMKRGTVNYLGFGTQSGSYGSVGGLQTVDYKEATDFGLSVERPDESGEIFVGVENFSTSKNFLRLKYDPESAMVIVRQTFNDRMREQEAKVRIEKVGDVVQNDDGSFNLVKTAESTDDVRKLTCEHVEEALSKSGLFVAGSSLMFAKWAKDFKQHVNELPLFDVETSNRVGGDPQIRYFHSYWKLADDECLVIKANPHDPQRLGKLMTWNFQVNNHWIESLDYRYYRIHVNAASANYRPDKSICIVLSHRDPDALKDAKKFPSHKGFQWEGKEYDWLHTTGHYFGTMCFRWIKPEFLDNVPVPQTQVCKFADLPGYL